MKQLTPRQKRFCEEYMVDLNATQAAIRANYAESGARTQAVRLLANDNIQNEISKLKSEASEILNITKQDTLRKLNDWASSDITVALGLSVEEIKNLPLEIRQLISGFKHTRRSFTRNGETITEDVVDLKFVNKETAQDMINRHTGFYEKDNEQKTNNIILVKLPDNGRG
ncbi:terminase small subunit [Leeuwenhoekiella aestuarii]|uniref:Phage terminase small subunit n=1 Tax=Leeuwenhoekiella aestuarii TaxID=2249426 RepID=A0A4Q0NS84_9FLAO|nr:terminase small subunit [Leeuwenhoekiella aestuarii]RXG13975.1 phage terminase small subunit [Leeuwenhoekiella aestuarii]|tara:strand:- start:8796 stop:9305 length:510 start_codon:yes stop_codon:yes gene_type:complete